MLFRQGALVVLAGALPLAAAGTLTPATRPWFKKVTGWMMALIFYKPAPPPSTPPRSPWSAPART